MTKNRLHPDHDDAGREAGFTLVELIVYILLATLLLGAIGVMLANSWRTQKNVASVTEATNRGQFLSSSIERALRNAVEFKLTAGGSELWVHTSLSGGLACQGFRLAPNDGRWTNSAGALPPSVDWHVWEPALAQKGSTPFLTNSGNTVIYTFDIKTESAPVRFTGEVSTRSTPTGVTSPCW